MFKKTLLIIGLVAVFGAGFWAGGEFKTCPFCPPEDVDFSIMWEAWHKLKEAYVNPEELNEKEMVYGATKGMIGAAGDPYTVFFTPEEAERFLEDVSGEFQGVGMEIGIKNGQLQVVAPIKGTPAERAGLRPGDKIIKIGETFSADIAVEEAVSIIRGPKGTEVVLTILRDDWSSPKEIKIIRDIIKVPSAEWELKQNTAYIKIYQFSETLNRDFNNIASEILKSSAENIVLDLRGNPGGYLEVAQDIAGWFLEKGDMVVIEDFGEGKEETVYEAKGNSRFLNYPVVVIINQGTASASEILAAALRDNRDINLVGEISFGKGSVQKMESLSDGSSLKVTVARWLTPLRSHISGKGLEPDAKIEMTEDDYENKRDPQLEKALEIAGKMN
ncbi:MAG: hypothetical protein A2365_01995 [Candidatus Nealsonbacteria bacterium RIFOXYB1_FULL_40_15]|uniref:PDZ domain-containing protein n=2 Tax=Candidatus Nealsoniibacteriota TaxID=1817911 RepID=A0A1G2ETF7_9BACT|nr:MAG: hypothetical protein A2365_01995 [Candidatus Nealsonbacteria bacterium RIFOXYB1_FULL_40_15]OGZ29102.1 MAG: hypothetical protein A2562_01560 [Candidatus Nealsonbacteria bacterium RIFOXYD1_FULL_39_11]OGZ29125.1 MAG: hypothetical protein A2427_02445 [Candidatus Nealsonbacteria bacterium RIFOXYC1_FULL_40_7]